MKIQKRNYVGVGGRGCSGWRIRVDVNEELKFLWKFKKIFWGEGSGRGGQVGSGWRRVRVDVNEELKFLRKFTKKNPGGQVGRRYGGWWGGRVDVNAMLGIGGDVGYGGCEPRIEGIVQYTIRYCTILRK